MCEIISYTILPRAFVKSIINKIPELGTIFSYIFCWEDMVQTEEYMIKDLSQLLLNRNASDIIVVDVDESRIDDEIFSSIVLQHRYDGSINYNQILLVTQTIRQVSKKHQPLASSEFLEMEGPEADEINVPYETDKHSMPPSHRTIESGGAEKITTFLNSEEGVREPVMKINQNKLPSIIEEEINIGGPNVVVDL